MEKQKKNSIIELLRFLFATSVVFYHVSFDLWDNSKAIANIGEYNITFFSNGWIAVDFFFVLSGYLMAKVIWKEMTVPSGRSLSGETVRFLWRKVKTVYVYYLPACAVMIVLYIIQGYDWNNILRRMPSVLFLQRTGAFPYSLISVTWYISSMLIAFAILYPICKKFYKYFTMILAPIMGLVIIGVIIHSTHTLTGTTEWLGITYKCNYRALAEVALGTTCFEAGRRLREIPFKTAARVFFSCCAFISLLLVGAYIMSDMSGEAGPYFVLLICIALTIIFSEIGQFGQSRLFQNKLFLFLGAISLPIYLFQNIGRILVPMFFSDCSKGLQSLIIYVGIICLSIIAYLLVTKIREKQPVAGGNQDAK